MNYFSMEEKVVEWYKNIPDAIKKSILYSFLLINLAFLFHTINFMFGDHDWTYIKQQTSWKEGAFEGRPLHFVLQSVLFSGQVLPILNNLFSFFALTTSSIMLGIYWRIPKTTLNYTLFATFVGVMPYTLVWLFYAKDALINLSLPLIVMTSLILARIQTDTLKQKIILNILSTFLIFFALSSYVAVINMVGVCVLGAILIDYLYKKDDFVSIIKSYVPTIINVVVAVIIFQIYMKLNPIEASYNTKIIPLNYVLEKFFITLDVMFSQFAVILPFMELKYKLLLLIMVILGLVSLTKSSDMLRFIPSIGIMLLILFSSKFAYFISDARGEILAEMEELAYVPRLDFYGIVYIYALCLSFILSKSTNYLRKTGVVLVIILTFMSIVRDTYALKTWKLGFDAEMKAHERIVSRIEEHPQYIASRQYRILQLGSLSLRKNFYKKQRGEIVGLDMLETSFTPNYMSHLVYNFYYPKDMFHHNVQEYAVSNRGKNFILHEARPWPAEKSIFIDGDIIILVLTEDGLTKAKEKLY